MRPPSVGEVAAAAVDVDAVRRGQWWCCVAAVRCGTRDRERWDQLFWMLTGMGIVMERRTYAD